MNTEDSPVTVNPGRDWVAFVGPPLGFAGPILCRVARVQVLLRIVDLHVSGDGRPITAAPLRQLPLSVMERVATTALIDNWRYDRERVEVLWSLDELQGFRQKMQFPQDRDVDLGALPKVSLYGRSGDRLKYVVKHDPPLNWVKGQAVTDEFLRCVGDAFDAAIQRGESPAKSIAESTGAKQKTVHSWIYQARNRGVIPPSQGKGRIK